MEIVSESKFESIKFHRRQIYNIRIYLYKYVNEFQEKKQFRHSDEVITLKLSYKGLHKMHLQKHWQFVYMDPPLYKNAR